jgi:hypothetical protein
VELLFLRARYYEPGTGRFISKDPLAGFVRVPQSLHIYVYAWNRPSQLIDPNGKQVPPGQCRPGEVCNSGTGGPYVNSMPMPSASFGTWVPIFDPTNPTRRVSWHFEAFTVPFPKQQPSAFISAYDPCAAPGWLLLHYCKPASEIEFRQEFFPQVADYEGPLGIMISGETGPRRVRIYDVQGRLIDEYWEGVNSYGLAIGGPRFDVSVNVEATSRGDLAVGLEFEVPVSEIELQVSQDEFGVTTYFDSPAWMTPKVGYGFSAGFRRDRYLAAPEDVVSGKGGGSGYGKYRIGTDYYLLDPILRFDTRQELLDYWLVTECKLDRYCYGLLEVYK